MPPQGDSPADQSSLIRNLIREKLRRGLGCRSRRSEREDSVSSSLSQEGSRSSRSSRSRSVRRSRSPSSSRCSRSRSRCSSRSHAPSRSSHVSGGSSRAPPSLSRHSLVFSPIHASRRTTPSATVSQAPHRLLLHSSRRWDPLPLRTRLALARCRLCRGLVAGHAFW